MKWFRLNKDITRGMNRLEYKVISRFARLMVCLENKQKEELARGISHFTNSG